MQRNKSKKDLSDIAKFCTKDNIFIEAFGNLLKEFDLRYINVLLSKSKSKGQNPANVFQIIFVLQFFDLKNISQFFLSKKSQLIDFKKDVFYEFMKNAKIDWRSILFLFIRQALKVIENKSVKEITAAPPPCFFILDDTLLEKTGKHIEFIGKVYDHCTHTYSLGMKLLTLGFWDGKSFMPLDFSLHNEPGKTGNRGLRKKDITNQFSKQREQGTAGFQRVLEISVDKIQMAINIVNNAIKKGIKADYVLADSWFMSESFISGILQLSKKINIIGLMKANRNVVYNNKTYRANNIPEIFRKKIVQNRTFKCCYIPLLVTYKGIELKMFWIKMNGQTNWKLLVSTDKKLSFINTMKYYQVRWSIEVFFKDCKQNLGLNSNQSIDFDANVAHISIVMMNYIVLSLKKRFEDYETLGELFRHTKENLLEQTMIEKIWEIIIELYVMVFSELGTDLEQFVLKIIELRKSIEDVMKNALNIIASLNHRAA